MDAKTLLEVAEWMKSIASTMATASPIPTVVAGGTQLTQGGNLPGDLGFRGARSVGKDWKDINGNLLGPAEPGDGWQIMLRRYWRDDKGDPSDSNVWVREKFARGECSAPKFPNAKQEWEE